MTHRALGRSTDERSLPAPLPSSSAAAGSFKVLALPELPRFSGPGNHLLAGARWAAPLLVLGGYYTLAIHGLLSLPVLVVGGALGGAAVLASHGVLVTRRRRLLRTARKLREYAERTVGDEHELFQRATWAVAQLEKDHASACDPSLTTDVEQGIGYTRELLLGVKDGREAPARHAARGARSL